MLIDVNFCNNRKKTMPDGVFLTRVNLSDTCAFLSGRIYLPAKKPQAKPKLAYKYYKWAENVAWSVKMTKSGFLWIVHEYN